MIPRSVQASPMVAAAAAPCPSVAIIMTKSALASSSDSRTDSPSTVRSWRSAYSPAGLPSGRPRNRAAFHSWPASSRTSAIAPSSRATTLVARGVCGFALIRNRASAAVAAMAQLFARIGRLAIVRLRPTSAGRRESR